MAEAKKFKVVAAESTKQGTKHRVQLEIHKRMPGREVERVEAVVVEGKLIPAHDVVSYPVNFRPIYIKNVVLDNVTATTIQAAAAALVTEFKALPREKKSNGFASYEQEFDQT